MTLIGKSMIYFLVIYNPMSENKKAYQEQLSKDVM